MTIVVKKYEVDKKPGETGQYSTKQKLKVVAIYLETGSLAHCAALTGFPYQTIRQWHVEDWWKDAEYDLKKQRFAKISKKTRNLTKIADEVLVDRLQNGEPVFNQKTGTVEYMPVKTIVANKVLDDAVKRELALHKLEEESKKTISEESIVDRLKSIQAMIRGNKKPELPVIEMEEVQDAVYEEREEGLQEGSGVGRSPQDQNAGQAGQG